MAKYHPIGVPVKPSQIIKLSDREVELIRMMRRVEGEEYHPLIRQMWKDYYSQMELLKIDTTFIKTKIL